MTATHFTFAAGGTLPYIAPEQLRGHAEAASDIFAPGVILYQLCTGRYPFRRTIQDLRQRDPLVPPPLPSSLYPLLPPELDDVILTALSENPADRFADALDFWDSIDAIITADARLIVGKTSAQAKSILKGQVGMADVFITLNGTQNDQLPDDVTQIDVQTKELFGIVLRINRCGLRGDYC